MTWQKRPIEKGQLVREADIKFFLVAVSPRKKNFFWRPNKKNPKNVATKLEGGGRCGKALLAGPLKKNNFVASLIGYPLPTIQFIPGARKFSVIVTEITFYPDPVVIAVQLEAPTNLLCRIFYN